MAVYKVIQDIEAEDKLLGPLTLKGFIYIAIAGVLAFVNVRIMISGAPIYLKLAIVFILILPMLLFGVLASPLGRDQPTEVWLLSHIRFILKQHLRVWDQTGLDNLVTITAPKRLEQHLTKEFSQSEVRSRLQALATTLDSRGWAVKNSAVNLSSQPDYLGAGDGSSDRLITPSSTSQPNQVIDVHASDDILDEQNNATAQHFSELMKQSDAQRKEAIVEKIDEARRSGSASPGVADSRFLDSTQRTGSSTFVGRAIVSPQDESSEITDNSTDNDSSILPAEAQAILEREHKRAEDIHRRSAKFKSHATQKAQAEAAKRQAQEEKAKAQAVTAAQAAAKLELVQSGNDLSVASIAQLVNHAGQVRQIGPGEVEISLH